MNKKALVPLMIIAIVAVAAAVTITLTHKEKAANTSTMNTSTDPLQAEGVALDSLSNTINAQVSDEALVPELETTLSDLGNDSVAVSADQALDDTAITNEGQSLTDLESAITTSRSDETAANETTDTLLDATQ